MPKKLSLGADNFVDIIDKVIAKNPKLQNAPSVELVLLLGLMDSFPCE